MRKRAFGAGAALFLLVAPLVPAGTAGGGVPTAKNPSASELRDHIGEASAAEAAALQELDEIRSRRRDLDAKVAAFDTEIAAIEARIDELRAEIARLAERVKELERQVTVAQARVDEAKQRAAAAAAAMYRSEGGVSAYAEVLDVENFNEAFVATKYLDHISDLRREQIDALAGLIAEIERLRHDAAVQRDDIAAAQAQAEQERDEIATLRAEQQRERDAVAAEEQRERELIAAIRARKDEFESQLASLQSASGTVRSILVSAQSGDERASSFHLQWPVSGGITSGYGWRVHPVLGTGRLHAGVDMAAGYGQRIRAAASGTVLRAGVQGGYGNTVVIDHGGQFGTVYAHASSITVSAGEWVEAGQVIALAGSSGLATGPHLHFEVRILGEPVNPAGYL